MQTSFSNNLLFPIGQKLSPVNNMDHLLVQKKEKRYRVILSVGLVYIFSFLFVFLFADFAEGVSFVKDLPGRVGWDDGRRSGCAAACGPGSHAARTSSHHEDTQDYHGNGKYPPPSKAGPESFVASHLYYLLSIR